MLFFCLFGRCGKNSLMILAGDGSQSCKKTGGGAVEETEKRPVNGRNANGTFAKGNKVGGRKPLPITMKELAAAAPEALQKLAEDPRTPAAVRVNIYQDAMNRVYGKPAQALEVDAKASVSVVESMTLAEKRKLLEQLKANDASD